ncbi:hypothetical protein E5F05_17525 [Deinococcus metallilatus]|uniref:DinB family protein n=1 Tax=Deinococcus metallilatus TaxID=1211322 RepID=A0AAJ5F248_9DEIO|nr:hypothetical protein [Deinococcus metallilatus]MBB5296840.1 hypothetical protein [Deinococcus metallilatus]QBY09575.1 hypothetical protein E5F05_17525 [Deinococcus metallilatus]RXJ09179.1 hypothetical protein ERJ73_16360 [Deinococcus metallilatus]TLK22777.1 hypothetical protein FCS05_17125 [Deinococcus metallilatus]GMA13872.1 hypothetical protein GCM10025871_02030 [Deinococcus metallilatus]
MNGELTNYQSRAIRALVLLHERHLRDFVQVWRQAKKGGVVLPVTGEDQYRSLENLLLHVFQSGRQYLARMCEHLGRPDPELAEPPSPGDIEAQAGPYCEYLLGRWRTVLTDVQDSELEPEVYTPGMHYWIDAMLEHAVMHPIRHEFQLRELQEAQGRA